jgi:ethanolamine ammonia-lyase small subunit
VRRGIGLAPVVLAHQSRVALGDDIGETLKARAVAILIGEQPFRANIGDTVALRLQPLPMRLPGEVDAEAVR